MASDPKVVHDMIWSGIELKRIKRRKEQERIDKRIREIVKEEIKQAINGKI